MSISGFFACPSTIQRVSSNTNNEKLAWANSRSPLHPELAFIRGRIGLRSFVVKVIRKRVSNEEWGIGQRVSGLLMHASPVTLLGGSAAAVAHLVSQYQD
jgi:hypothetical protein